MKLLILNGGPKTTHSATLLLTEAFVAGIAEVGPTELERLHVSSMDIGYCRGCFACRETGRCFQKDDMEGILASMVRADVLLFAFPLYGYSVPSQLKAVLDRMLPLSSPVMRRTEHEGTYHPALYDHSRQRFIMLSGCGFPNARHNFEPVELMFRYMFRHDLTEITVAEAPMLLAPEAAEVTGPFLERVREAGREYGRNGCLSAETLEALRAPMIPEALYARICSGEA